MLAVQSPMLVQKAWPPPVLSLLACSACLQMHGFAALSKIALQKMPGGWGRGRVLLAHCTPVHQPCPACWQLQASSLKWYLLQGWHCPSSNGTTIACNWNCGHCRRERHPGQHHARKPDWPLHVWVLGCGRCRSVIILHLH